MTHVLGEPVDGNEQNFLAHFKRAEGSDVPLLVYSLRKRATREVTIRPRPTSRGLLGAKADRF